MNKIPPSEHERFVRVPTKLLEALLGTRFTGTQLRIILWFLRQTYGWNRRVTPFSWYRIAKQLALDRGGTVRAGHDLLRRGVLSAEGKFAGIDSEVTAWRRFPLVPRERLESGAVTDVSDDGHKPKPMTEIIQGGDDGHRDRCDASSVFRPTKDSCKDKSQTHKQIRELGLAPPLRRRGGNVQQRWSAGAAHPIPDKYGRLSKN